jgi:L-asparaginase II
MIAGTGRFDTDVTELLGSRAFVKTGAEGVYCASLPEAGVGIALKIADGATRAAECAMAALLARFLPLADAERAVLMKLSDRTLVNWRGLEIGRIRPSAALQGG